MKVSSQRSGDNRAITVMRVNKLPYHTTVRMAPFDPVADEEPPDVVVLELVELSGPVKNRFPATGLPSPTAAPKVLMLKLLRGVDELTNMDATLVKLAG